MMMSPPSAGTIPGFVRMTTAMPANHARFASTADAVMMSSTWAAMRYTAHGASLLCQPTSWSCPKARSSTGHEGDGATAPPV